MSISRFDVVAIYRWLNITDDSKAKELWPFIYKKLASGFSWIDVAKEIELKDKKKVSE